MWVHSTRRTLCAIASSHMCSFVPFLPDETVDPDGTGSVGFGAFEAAMARKLRERSSADEMKKAFALFDDDGSGRVRFVCFVCG